MKTYKKLKFLSLISSLYRVGDINSEEKAAFVKLMNEDKDVEITKKLNIIKSFSVCTPLIEQFLKKEETQYE